MVVGVSGQAASQRSVISEHRSESDARESAELERARLEVIYGEGADAWRIQVLHDGKLVAEERPAGRPDAGAVAGEPPVPTPLDAPPRGEDDPADADADADADPSAEADPAAPAEPGAPEPPGAPVAGGAAPRRERWPDLDAELSGPVPEWVIERVEASIARRAERERGRARDDDPADAPGEGR